MASKPRSKRAQKAQADAQAEAIRHFFRKAKETLAPDTRAKKIALTLLASVAFAGAAEKGYEEITETDILAAKVLSEDIIVDTKSTYTKISYLDYGRTYAWDNELNKFNEKAIVTEKEEIIDLEEETSESYLIKTDKGDFEVTKSFFQGIDEKDIKTFLDDISKGNAYDITIVKTLLGTHDGIITKASKNYANSEPEDAWSRIRKPTPGTSSFWRGGFTP